MNCIIVDDEPVARKGMKSLVEQIPQLTLVGSFNNAIAASAYINEYTVDLIFLDIQMPGITGIEFDTGRIYLHQIGTTLYQDKLQ